MGRRASVCNSCHMLKVGTSKAEEALVEPPRYLVPGNREGVGNLPGEAPWLQVCMLFTHRAACSSLACSLRALLHWPTMLASLKAAPWAQDDTAPSDEGWHSSSCKLSRQASPFCITQTLQGVCRAGSTHSLCDKNRTWTKDSGQIARS